MVGRLVPKGIAGLIHLIALSAGNGLVYFSLPFLPLFCPSVCEDFCWALQVNLHLTYVRHFWLSFLSPWKSPDVDTDLVVCERYLWPLFDQDIPGTFHNGSQSAAAPTRSEPTTGWRCHCWLSHINCLHAADKQRHSCMKCLHFSNPHGALVSTAIESHYCSFIADEWRMSKLLWRFRGSFIYRLNGVIGKVVSLF